jgi:hypothetical protein
MASTHDTHDDHGHDAGDFEPSNPNEVRGPAGDDHGHGAHARGHDDHGHDDHGHDDHHGDHGPVDDKWVLAPILVGFVIGIVLVVIFGLASGVSPA